MGDSIPALRVATRELLANPGARRAISVALPRQDLAVDDERITAPIEVDLLATSTLDSVIVAGTIAVSSSAPCRRCLDSVVETRRIPIDEIYQHDADPAGAAIPYSGDIIDLTSMVRETVVLESPDLALCRADCRGICPECGIDRNHDQCDCSTERRDERWAVLDQLEIDP